MSSHRTSLAVLPFEQKGNLDDYPYFGEGIGEEIIKALSAIPELKVCSRRSSFSLAHSDLSVQALAEKLQVENILEGSVQIANNQVRISASLIEAANDETYWSDSWNRPLSNIFEVQDEISLLIADQLREHFGHLEISDHLVHSTTSNVDAFSWELKGRKQFNKWNPQDVHTAIGFFKKAIELDSEFLDAYIGMADAYGFLATTGFGDPISCWQKAKDAMDFVFEREPLHPGLNYQLANFEFFTKASYARSYHYAKITIQSREGYPEGQQFMAFMQMLRGDMKKAGDHVRYAMAIDPLNAETRFYEGYYHYRLHEYGKSIAICQELLADNPQNLPALIVNFYAMILNGDSAKLLEDMKSVPDVLLMPDEKLGLEALAYHALQLDVESEKAYLELEKRSEQNASPQADAYFYLNAVRRGNFDRAFEVLDKLFSHQSAILLLNFSDPLAGDLVDDPRHADYHQRIFNLETEAKSEKKSSLHLNNVEGIRENLTRLMGHDQVYLDPKLNLRDLATRLQIHPNQLSWLLNEELDVNFNDFINQYRIDHFIELATDSANAHISLIGLAYESGFNSKSVFNTSFKKLKGQTPSQFISALK